MVDISEFGAENDVEFCEWLVREIGVAAVPGSSFFREPVHHLIRFHFAKREETLRVAGRRLKKLLHVGSEFPTSGVLFLIKYRKSKKTVF